MDETQTGCRLMQFSQVLQDAGIRVLARDGQAPIGHVTADSRQVREGSCFLAVRGVKVDRHDFIAQAVKDGASAVVCEDPSRVPAGTAWAQVDNVGEAAGAIAQALHGWPARKLALIGVTGTKGKTTFAYLVRHILEFAGRPTGLIGTICYELGGRSVLAWNTTPGPVELAELMDEMVRSGLNCCVMEVSSHALDQGRTVGLPFAAAAFTNLTGDHLDYHHTPEQYLAAKARLFTSLAPEATAVLNADDSAAGKIAAQTDGQVLWYGLGGSGDLLGRIERVTAGGTAFEMLTAAGSFAVASTLVGRHNVSNCLAAAGACMVVGVGVETVVEALSAPIAVPGRFQPVPCEAGFDVLVDYAHTDDALDNALTALRPLTEGDLIVMFGCGGDRDRTKRPRMAAVAAKLADRVVLTQDNPRTEDPQQIIDDIMAGFDDEGRKKLHVQLDRAAAIADALDMAGRGDVVVLAGKGHEDYQIIGTVKHHFDDAQVAAEHLRRREQSR